MKLWKKIVEETSGAEIAEAAAVLPLVFMLLLGIYWFGRAYNIYATATHAAREGARMAVTDSCATCGDAAPTATQVAAHVADALRASKLDPNRVSQIVPSYCSCGDTSCTGGPVGCARINPGDPQICVQYNVALTSSTQVSSCGVAVSFQYPYQFYFPFTSLNLQQINLKAQSQVSGEQ